MQVSLTHCTGIIDGNYVYVAVKSTEGKTFQVANMNTPELVELMNMYNRSCSHIDFEHLQGPLGTLTLSSAVKIPGNSRQSVV